MSNPDATTEATDPMQIAAVSMANANPYVPQNKGGDQIRDEVMTDQEPSSQNEISYHTSSPKSKLEGSVLTSR